MNRGFITGSRNEVQQFSLENKGQTVVEEIQDGAFSRESDVDGILGLLGIDLQ